MCPVAAPVSIPSCTAGRMKCPAVDGAMTFIGGQVSPWDGPVVEVRTLCDGGEFFDNLIDGCLPIDDSLCWFLQMAEAVAHCHELFVAHRDIKPENFLFESDRPDAELKCVPRGLSTPRAPAPHRPAAYVRRFCADRCAPARAHIRLGLG